MLVRAGEHALILDAGTGLAAAAPYLDGVTRIDIALTHFHLDHVFGLSHLPELPVAPTIRAPGAWLYDTQPERAPARRPCRRSENEGRSASSRPTSASAPSSSPPAPSRATGTRPPACAWTTGSR